MAEVEDTSGENKFYLCFFILQSGFINDITRLASKITRLTIIFTRLAFKITRLTQQFTRFSLTTKKIRSQK